LTLKAKLALDFADQ